MRIALAVIIMLLAVAPGLSAQNMESDTASRITPPAISQQMGPTLLRMGLALFLILVLIYLSVFLMKKMTNAKMSKQGLSGVIDVVDRHHLAPKKQICLVRVDKKYLLVGVSDQSINLVADVSDQDFQKREAVSKPQYQGFSFKKLFSEARMNLPLFTHQADSPQKS